MTRANFINKAGSVVIAITLGVLGASTVNAAAPAASAASSTSVSPSANSAARLQQIQQRSATAIANREVVLSKLASDVSGATALTSGDRAGLSATIAADQPALTALGVKIAQDTNAQQAYADAQTIVTGYRVYVLVEPVTHLTIALDTESGAITTLLSLEPTLQQAINNSSVGAGQKAAAQAAYNDYITQVNSAQGAVNGQPTSNLLALKPAGYPGNLPTMQAALTAVRNARHDLSNARNDVQTITNALTTH